MKTEPHKEHAWLQKLVGEWAYEVVAATEAGAPPARFRGRESVAPLGDLWIVADGEGEMPGGNRAQNRLTLGYDPQKKLYVGAWAGSMMPHLWLYEGELDADGRQLTLNTEGPGVGGKTAKFKDVIELNGDDERVQTSHMLGEDGTWYGFMRATYRRIK